MRSGAWAAGVSMAEVRVAAAAAVLGGELYLLGGMSHYHSVLGTAEAFDGKSGAWAAVAPMSTVRAFAAAATLGGRLYVIGGCDGDDEMSSVESFDPQTGAWLEVAPMPSPRSGQAAAVLGGKVLSKVYVVGGIGAHEEKLNTVEVYDPATNSWAAAAPMSTARNVPGVAAPGSVI